MKDQLISGLDIGSTEIKVAVGQIREEDGKIDIIGLSRHPSEGVNRGVIISIEDAVASISKCLEKVERMIGFSLSSAFVGISGTRIICQRGRGIISVSNPKEIREEDEERAIENAQTVATPLNYEVIQTIPLFFNVDDQQRIRDPLGMSGRRLEVEAEIILGLNTHIENIRKCVTRSGLYIDALFFSILAAAEVVTTLRQKELGVVVVDLGGTTTSLAVFEEGNLLLAKVLPIGGNHITNDLALGLRISIDLAEKIKLIYGTALSKEVSRRKEIRLEELDEQEKEVVSQKDVADIVEPRVEEIFRMVDKELVAIGRSGKLPGGVILTGGGAKLKGVADVAKRVLRLPVSIGYPRRINSVIDKIDDPSFITAIGLIAKAFGEMGAVSVQPSHLKRIIKKVGNWFKIISTP